MGEDFVYVIAVGSPSFADTYNQYSSYRVGEDLAVHEKAGSSMIKRDIFLLSLEKIKHYMRPLWRALVLCMQWWYYWTCQAKPSVTVPLMQKEAWKRGEFTSNVLLILILSWICTFFPVCIFSDKNILPSLAGYIASLSFVLIATYINRKGQNILAGSILITGIEITFILVMCFHPTGLDVSTLTMLDFFVLPTLLTVSMLPPGYVFPVALGNIGLICTLISALPKSVPIQYLISTSPSAIYAIPILLQFVIAGVSYLWVHGAMQVVKEADRADELDILYREQAHAAVTDPITSLPNHRAIMKHMLDEIMECEQKQQVCTIMFVDLDHFKQINDTWGHLAGDAVLREVGRRLHDTVAPDGIAGRYGGEEFAVLLKGMNIHDACQIAEEARITIASAPCTWQADDKGGELIVTASIGIAVYSLHGTTLTALLEQADQAMYRAKQCGRNRVCVADVFSENEQEQVTPPADLPNDPQVAGAFLEAIEMQEEPLLPNFSELTPV
jgi:diguanylate cyclase (GGDEF)-like protein